MLEEMVEGLRVLREVLEGPRVCQEAKFGHCTLDLRLIYSLLSTFEQKGAKSYVLYIDLIVCAEEVQFRRWVLQIGTLGTCIVQICLFYLWIHVKSGKIGKEIGSMLAQEQEQEELIIFEDQEQFDRSDTEKEPKNPFLQ